MKQLFEKKYLHGDVRAFFDGVDGIYLVADESWFESKEFDDFMLAMSRTTYSVMYFFASPIELQLESVKDYEEVIV